MNDGAGICLFLVSITSPSGFNPLVIYQARLTLKFSTGTFSHFRFHKNGRCIPKQLTLSAKNETRSFLFPRLIAYWCTQKTIVKEKKLVAVDVISRNVIHKALETLKSHQIIEMHGQIWFHNLPIMTFVVEAGVNNAKILAKNC